jgi:HlyD family secretion protein
MKKYSAIIFSLIVLAACGKKQEAYDASGVFEAVETIVSSEASGQLLAFNVEEGQEITKGQIMGVIDSTQLYLKKKQLQAQIKAVLSRKPDAASQLASLKTQLQQAKTEYARFNKLYQAKAATRKQVDDLEAQVKIITQQIQALETSLGITAASLNEETLPLSVQIEMLNDQLAKCRIVNPQAGIVITKYMETGEMAIQGKPLYKLADLQTMVCRTYITGDQFASIKLKQPVTVMIDAADGKTKSYNGIVEWISQKAEFTPKTIQTKDERANLVYAIKVKVKNDGYLKIGMYGEVKF